MDYLIYTDGSSDKDKNGGWSACVLAPSGLTELVGWESDTTNNRMELTAALRGLQSVPEGSAVALISDSAYLLNTLSKQWYLKWFADAEDPNYTYKRPNMDLWNQLANETLKRVVKYVKVKGHNGDKWNERADKLAFWARTSRVETSRAYDGFEHTGGPI